MSVKGVLKTKTDLEKHTATITFDDTKTSLEKIKEKLADDGYPVIGQPKWIK